MRDFEFNEKNLIINTSLDEELDALIYKRQLAKKATVLLENYISEIRQKIGVVIKDYSNIYFTSDSLNVLAHIIFSFNTTEKLTPIKVENLMDKIGLKTKKGNYPSYTWKGAKLNIDKKKYEINEETSNEFIIKIHFSKDVLKEGIEKPEDVLLNIIHGLNEYANNYDYEYGLPTYESKHLKDMVDIIKSNI